MSQKMSKTRVKPEQLVSFLEEPKKQAEIDVAKMREEARKVFQFHKSKFWGKIGGTSLDKVAIKGEN